MELSDSSIQTVANVLAAVVLVGLFVAAIRRAWRPPFCGACHTGSVLYPACWRPSCPGHHPRGYGRSQEVLKAHGPAA